MPELYHNINSVCAQKVRIALYRQGDDERMKEMDWAQLRNLSPVPWPKVESLLKAA